MLTTLTTLTGLKNVAKIDLPSSGVCNIENVEHRNWAVLVNDNDRGQAIAGTYNY
jgi:hypothetical protein